MTTLNVLLAEDNLGDILLVKEALTKYGIQYEMHIVRDGGEAMAFVALMGVPGGVPCPDLVLLDVNLPKVDGPEVLAEFRKHPQCTGTPVIVITSSDNRKDRDRMAALGVACYFRKPSDLEEFLRLGAVVREVMERSARP